MGELKVELGDRSYPIYIGEGLLSAGDYLRPHIRGRQACVVTNEVVAPLYLNQLKQQLNDLEVVDVVLPDGEAHKDLGTLNTVFDRLLETRQNRTTTLIGLGGGVVGDMAGFAAACYQRGVDFIQIPTTLLSQVDSSVGGKTGVNHPLGKNMIGAFYQPNCVLIDINVLHTLPDKELSAGLAEVIKYGLICDSEFFLWLERNMPALMARQPQALAYAIERSCAIKAEVVAEDERESGLRAILNLGHTFGHAIETAQGYGNWLHGEAVAAGMVIAAEVSRRMAWLSDKDLQRITRILSDAALPVHPPQGMTAKQFLDLMALDKKVLDGRIRLVLLQAIGKALVTSDIAPEIITQTLDSFGR